MSFNITSFRTIRWYLIGAFLLGVTISALSYSSGISGRTAPSSGCTCHGSSNSNTTVSLSSQSGNYTVNPGASANFTVTVANSSQTAGAVNIAVKTTSTGETNAGSLSPGSGSGLQTMNSELTHSSAKDFSSGQTSFDFSWTAPTSPGIYYMRAAGNAVNDNGQNSGDVWNFMATQQITVPGISVLTANGGESLCPGASYNITWDAVGVSNVKIELSTNGGSDFSTTLVASTDASAESWTWNIPSEITPGSQYKIRISDVMDNSRNDVSNGNFSIAVFTSISTHPVSKNVCTKQNVSFTIAAQGGSLTYQWRKNGGNLSGKTAATLSINIVQLTDAGNYDCVVSGACGNPVTSQVATLSVDESPNITTQPVSQQKCPGENVTFSVTASATNIAYQWRKNGTDIPGATTNMYSLNGVQASDAGNYSVRVSGSCNPAVISNNADLVVNSTPSVTSQPQNVEACENSEAQFSVTATGNNLTYQWRKNGTNISNATSSVIILGNITKADEGEYDVVINGACNGIATSNKATLKVKSKPVISLQPEDKTVTVGFKAEFKTATTTASSKFQWQKDGVNITDAKDSIYTKQSISLSDSGLYSCSITNSCGETISNAAKLTVSEKKLGPSISLSQEQIDFGLVNVNETEENTFEAIITNSGDETLSITAMNISGTNSSEFQIPAGTEPIEIEPGMAYDLSITFAPTSGGNKTAKLTFESNSNNEVEIVLSGFGGIVDIALSETELNFGDVEIGLSAEKKFVITNNGNYSVTFTEMNIGGSDASSFSADSVSLPFELTENGGEQEITVNFESTQSGLATALIEFNNSVNQEVNLNLTANGIVSSVEDILFNPDAMVYPNPSEGNVNFKIENKIGDINSIRIIDNLGNTVKIIELNSFVPQTNSFEWNGFDEHGNMCRSGYYTLVLSQTGSVMTYPFVISR